MTNKIKLISTGNEEGRSYYIFEKDNSFFSLFPKFLLGCGFNNLKEYEDYQDNFPDIGDFENKVEHFKNDEYDIDVVFTSNRIILIIRTSEDNRSNLISGIEKITS